jgi:lipopolysaccharide transport protein LptA
MTSNFLRAVFNTLSERHLSGAIMITSGEDKRARTSTETSTENSLFQPLPASAARKRLLSALGAGALFPVLLAGFALNARCAGPPIAADSVGAPPVASQATPTRHKLKGNVAKGQDTAAAAAPDSKGGTQGSPFGMLKFSADNGPIQIKSDSLSLDYKANSVEFIGNVHAEQSGTTLISKTLKVLYGDKFGDIKEVIALGDVKMTQGGRWATGQRAVLDEVKHTVEMTGQPVIHDGADQVAGRRIIVYLDTEKSFVEDARAVIIPRASGKNDHEAGD